MGMMTSYQPGQFCWVDLMTHDIDRAKKFYGELLGWQAQDQHAEGKMIYVIFKIGQRQVAGMGAMDETMKSQGVPPIWNSYINVPDAAAAEKKAVELGGAVTMPTMQVMDAGTMAVIRDPSGAHVSVWQANRHIGADLVNEPGSLVWNELMTAAPEQAASFYEAWMGWTFEKEDSPNDYWIIRNGDRLNGGMMRVTPEMGPMPPFWSVYFAVSDVEESADKAQSLGGQLVRSIFDVSIGRIAVATDDQGAMFNMIQMTVPTEA